MLGSSVLSLLALNISHLIGDEDEGDDDNEMNQQVTNASQLKIPILPWDPFEKDLRFPPQVFANVSNTLQLRLPVVLASTPECRTFDGARPWIGDANVYLEAVEIS
jgi:hypothetical protein